MKKLLLSAFVLSAGTAMAQWTPQATGFTDATRGILTIDIVDENVVWCQAYDGTGVIEDLFEITRTSDGGTTWTPGLIDLGDPNLDINNMKATGADVAWVSSIDGVAQLGGALFKTTDGGGIWEFQDITPSGQGTAAFGYDSSFQNGVHFFNANEGIVFGDPVALDFEIYRTTDGGTTWSRVPAANMPNANNANEWGYNGGNVGAGDFFWMVTNDGRLFRSADKGLNWTVSQSPMTDFGSAAVNARVQFSAIDGDITHAVGILLGTVNGSAPTPTYTRYTTTNGGTSWTNAGTDTSAYRNYDFIPGTSMLVATGNNGTVYTTAYSTDLGATWTEISNDDVQRTSIAFLNGTTGWAGGFNEDSTTGGIFKYTGASLGIPSAPARQQFTATPNPTNGVLQVANETTAITDVVVYDLLGKQVYKGKFSALNQVNLDLTPLNTGSYILKATSETGATQTIKIVKN